MDQWLLVYVAIGAFIGFFAGMLGMGGGGIQVPLTTMAFAAQGFPREHMLHVALGTAMATVIFTSLSSLRAHDRHGAVNWGVLRRLLPGIVIGTGLGHLAGATHSDVSAGGDLRGASCSTWPRACSSTGSRSRRASCRARPGPSARRHRDRRLLGAGGHGRRHPDDSVPGLLQRAVSHGDRHGLGHRLPDRGGRHDRLPRSTAGAPRDSRRTAWATSTCRR